MKTNVMIPRFRPDTEEVWLKQKTGRLAHSGHLYLSLLTTGKLLKRFQWYLSS